MLKKVCFLFSLLILWAITLCSHYTIASFIFCGVSILLFLKIVNQLTHVPYIQYPVAFHTVDIVATHQTDTGVEVLLGRKYKATDWVFIGGFVDPTNTAESAALRELHEETHVIVDDESRLTYLGSLFINDNRFKESCHKVTTSIFTIELTDEEYKMARGGDDIEKVKWVRLEDVIFVLKEHHVELFNKFLASKPKWFKSPSL
jgi:8-oxo-dGTP pyrophosphatase MutT (NUDIX family)